ncbi:MAG TPA: hypothetical protein DHW79_06495 [Candidatus Cloacimonas sp.]|jgi:hypothetical protein|nr:hypothetical protein [Candidatus Cloacimonas sp.]
MNKTNVKHTAAAFGISLSLYIILSLLRMFSFGLFIIVILIIEGLYLIVFSFKGKQPSRYSNPFHIYGILLTVILIVLDGKILHIIQ